MLKSIKYLCSLCSVSASTSTSTYVSDSKIVRESKSESKCDYESKNENKNDNNDGLSKEEKNEKEFVKQIHITGPFYMELEQWQRSLLAASVHNKEYFYTAVTKFCHFKPHEIGALRVIVIYDDLPGTYSTSLYVVSLLNYVACTHMLCFIVYVVKICWHI